MKTLLLILAFTFLIYRLIDKISFHLGTSSFNSNEVQIFDVKVFLSYTFAWILVSCEQLSFDAFTNYFRLKFFLNSIMKDKSGFGKCFAMVIRLLKVLSTWAIIGTISDITNFWESHATNKTASTILFLTFHGVCAGKAGLNTVIFDFSTSCSLP